MDLNNNMESKPILKLLISMSLPAILSMLIQSMYNIVDSMFVARLGSEALTAVSLVYPIQNLLLGIAVGTGVGVNSLISRTLGEKNIDKSNTVVSYSIILSFLTWAIFFVLGLVFIKPFLGMFTSSTNILELGVDYANIVVYFSFGIIFHIVIEKILQANGSMVAPMIFVLVGAITNIVLDPILIFGYLGAPSLGVKGAAIATVISQIISMTLAIITLLFTKSSIKIKTKDVKFDFSIVKEIYMVGLPATLMFVLGSVLVVGLNSIIINISYISVSVLGIFLRLQSFVFMPISGLTQGAMPIMGFNYGSNNRERLLSTLKASLVISVIIAILGNIIFLLIPDKLLYLFDSSNDMLEIGTAALRILSLSFVFMAINYIFSTLFQAIGNGMYSLIISLFRQGLITLPLSFFFSKTLGLNGVWITFGIAEFISVILSIILFKKLYNSDKVLSNAYPSTAT